VRYREVSQEKEKNSTMEKMRRGLTEGEQKKIFLWTIPGGKGKRNLIE